MIRYKRKTPTFDTLHFAKEVKNFHGIFQFLVKLYFSQMFKIITFPSL